MDEQLIKKFRNAVKKFTSDELDDFARLKRINFIDNPSDDEIITFFDETDMEEFAPAYFMLLHNQKLSKDVQEYIITYFDLDEITWLIPGERLNLILDEYILKKGFDNHTVSFKSLPEKYKTDEMFIYAFKDKYESYWMDNILELDFINEGFIERNFERQDISYAIAKAMFVFSHNDAIRTYLMMAYAFENEY